MNNATCMETSNLSQDFKLQQKNILTKTEIILGEPSQLYFLLLTDSLSLFTFMDLLGEICKFSFENKHLYALQADFLCELVIVFIILAFFQQIMKL